MSGAGFSELLILCLIGLVVLGPKRLPEVANRIGTWIGQARRMTRVMKRQLEDELDLKNTLSPQPHRYSAPLDDDTYSPLHQESDGAPAAEAEAEADTAEPVSNDTDDQAALNEPEETRSERPKDR